MDFRYQNCVIESMSYQLPKSWISSDEIETKLLPIYDALHLNVGRLELMTGVQNRFLGDLKSRPSTLATSCAKKILKEKEEEEEIEPLADVSTLPPFPFTGKMGTPSNKDEIDFLIYAAVCRDFLEPATAAIIHNNLQLSNQTPFLDLSNACLGIASALQIACEMVESKRAKKVLVVASENSSPLLHRTINYLLEQFHGGKMSKDLLKKHLASLTIGSGSFSCICSHRDEISRSGVVKELFKINGFSFLANTKVADLCHGGLSGEEGMLMETNSNQLLEAGIKLAYDNWNQFKKFIKSFKGDNDNDNDNDKAKKYYIPHQVGSIHRRELAKVLELKEEELLTTFELLGNVGPVSMPLTLLSTYLNKTLNDKDQFYLLGIGSGLSSLMIHLEYEKTLF